MTDFIYWALITLFVAGIALFLWELLTAPCSAPFIKHEDELDHYDWENPGQS